MLQFVKHLENRSRLVLIALAFLIIASSGRCHHSSAPGVDDGAAGHPLARYQWHFLMASARKALSSGKVAGYASGVFG